MRRKRGKFDDSQTTKMAETDAHAGLSVLWSTGHSETMVKVVWSYDSSAYQPETAWAEVLLKQTIISTVGSKKGCE